MFCFLMINEQCFLLTYRLQHLNVWLLWLYLYWSNWFNRPSCLWPCCLWKLAYRCNKIQFNSCGTSIALDCVSQYEGEIRYWGVVYFFVPPQPCRRECQRLRTAVLRSWERWRFKSILPRESTPKQVAGLATCYLSPRQINAGGWS